MASKFLILILKALPSAACKQGMELKKDEKKKKERKNKRTLDVARRKESEIFPAKFQ